MNTYSTDKEVVQDVFPPSAELCELKLLLYFKTKHVLWIYHFLNFILFYNTLLHRHPYLQSAPPISLCIVLWEKSVHFVTFVPYNACFIVSVIVEPDCSQDKMANKCDAAM